MIISVLHTVFNKSIRPPPDVKFMPKLPKINSIGNYQNNQQNIMNKLLNWNYICNAGV